MTDINKPNLNPVPDDSSDEKKGSNIDPLNKDGPARNSKERYKIYLTNRRIVFFHPLSILAPISALLASLVAPVPLLLGFPKYISIIIILIGWALHYACLWGVFIRFSYNEVLATEVKSRRPSSERSFHKFREWIDRRSPHKSVNAGSLGALIAAATLVLMWR